jgi:hypothetical protein
MVSVLLVDVLPLVEPVLELELEPALQPAAAASRPAARGIIPYLVRRLMPLRPYCRFVRGAVREVRPLSGSRLGSVRRQYRIGQYGVAPSAKFVRTVS